MAKHSVEKILKIDLALIDEPKGIIRIDVTQDDISELAASISANGLYQPILVRPDGIRHEIVFGHRRFLAHKLLELQQIKAIVRKMSDSEAAVARAGENLARVDLTPLEEAATYRDLIDTYGMSVEKVAEKMGRTPGTIKHRMDILKMHPLLQQAIHKKRISMTVAEELWPISDASDLEYYLTFAIENGATKSVARAWCKEWKDKQRRAQETGESSGGPTSPFEPRPIYIVCDICQGPVELGKDKLVRMCPACWDTIRKI